MSILRKYCLYALSFCMAAIIMLVPFRVDAASGNISYPDEIQCVSSGDVLSVAAPYSMMKINEDYGVATAALSYPNALPDVSKSLLYVPSYDTTTDTISFVFHNGNYFGYNHNFFFFHTPLTVTSSNSNVNIVNYNLWVRYMGKVYDIGQTTWGQFLIDDKNISSQFLEFGIDIQLSCSESNDFDSDLVIDGQLIDGIQSGTYYESSGQYSGSFYGDVNFLIDDRYIDQIIENRAGSSVINISWSGASYNSDYVEREEIGKLNSINDAINQANTDIVSSVTAAKNSITDRLTAISQNIISSITDLKISLISFIQTQFTTLFSKLDQLISGFSDTGTTEAANKFDTSAGELESVESELTGITNSSIGSYTDTAFDTSVINSLGSSLVYVVTWFTNFWNMGGLFTSILNVGLALSVAFFILRLRGGS